MSVLTQGLLIQRSRQGQFKILHFIIFPVVYSFLGFLLKQRERERFSERRLLMLTVTLTVLGSIQIVNTTYIQIRLRLYL